MARPSIARELAQDQTINTHAAGIEAASSTAPRTLARPVLKKLMKNEEKRRAKGDGTGVQMTTTIQEERYSFDGSNTVNNVCGRGAFSPSMRTHAHDPASLQNGQDWKVKQLPDSPETGNSSEADKDSLRKSGSEATLPSTDSGRVPTSVSHPYSYLTTPSSAANQYVGAILDNGQHATQGIRASSPTRNAGRKSTKREKVVRIEPVQDSRACPWGEPGQDRTKDESAGTRPS